MLPHEAPEGGGMKKLDHSEVVRNRPTADHHTPQSLFTRMTGALKRIVHLNEQETTDTPRLLTPTIIDGGRQLRLFLLPLLLMFFVLPNVWAWAYSGWNYRQPITISNPNSTDLTDFQVKLTIDTASLISAGKMNSDCSDLRFADASDNPIPYWIEANCNTSSTVVWVKVPSIPANGEVNIYMYYGNQSATSESNGTAVFDFFDDFDGTALDTSKWSITQNNGGVDVNNSILDIWGGASAQTRIQSTQTFDSNSIIVRVRAYWQHLGSGEGGHLARPVVLIDGSTGYLTDFGWYSSTGYDVIEVFTNVGSTVNLSTLPEQFETYEYYYHNGSSCLIYLGNTTCNNNDAGLTTVNIEAWATDSHTYIDWIAVRKYAPQEPTATFGAEETAGVGVSISHIPTAQSDLALDPENNVTSITVDYNAVFNKNNVSVVYYRAYDGDNNTTILEGNQDVNYIVFNRTYTNIGDYNTCIFVKAVDSGGNEYNDTACDSVHIDEYPQAVDFNWTPILPLSDENTTLTATAQDNGTVSFSWDLGDGNTDTGNLITHSWPTGEYNVCLTATDNLNLSKTTCKSIPVFSWPYITVEMRDNNFIGTIHPDSRLTVISSEWNTDEGNFTASGPTFQTTLNNPPRGTVYYTLYYEDMNATRDLNDPIPYLDFNYTITVGFHPEVAEENISVDWNLESNVSCSFQAFDTNKSWTGGPSGEHNDTWTWKEGDNLSITIQCQDDLNNSARYTLTQAVLVYKIIPEDEETGVYDLNLWGDVQTGQAPLFRFIATDKEFNTSYIYEDMNQTLWLVLPPDKEWLLRFEEHFSDQVIINTYDLAWSPFTLPICVSPDKPNIYQTTYSSVPITDKAFGITRAETGCIRAIRQTEYVEGGYGFHFYTQAGQYAVWLIDKNWDTRTLLGSFFGDTKTVVDLEKLLLLIQKAESIPFPPYSVLEIKKVDDENATQFLYQTNEVLKTFELNVYRAGEKTPFFTQTLQDPGSKIRIVMYWSPYNLDPNETIIVKWKATYPDGRSESGEKRATPTGRLILFTWWQAVLLLILPALFLFMRMLNIQNLLIFSIVYVAMAILVLPYSEFTPATQMMGIFGVIAFIVAVAILRKVI